MKRPSLIQQAGIGHISLQDRLRAVRHAAPRHALVAIGALASYWICWKVWGHSRPYFAPLATVIVLGVSVGTQLRRAVQLVIGVSLGLMVADATVRLIGSGPWQLAVIIFLAMTIAVFAGGDALAVRQAAGAAVLVALVAIPGDPIGVTRLEDGLTGAAVAFLLALVISPVDPVDLAERTVSQVHYRLAGTLREIALALEKRDAELANDAIVTAREFESDEPEQRESLTAARDAVRLTLIHRRDRAYVERLASAAEFGLRAEQDTVALARSARRPVELNDPVPSDLPDGIREMASAAEAVAKSVGGSQPTSVARERILSATETSSASLQETTSLSVSLLVGQIRLVANDLLRAAGTSPTKARGLIRAAGD